MHFPSEQPVESRDESLGEEPHYTFGQTEQTEVAINLPASVSLDGEQDRRRKMGIGESECDSKRRKMRNTWGRHLLSSFDWDENLSSDIANLFEEEKPYIFVQKLDGDTLFGVINSTELPNQMIFAHETATGEVAYGKFLRQG